MPSEIIIRGGFPDYVVRRLRRDKVGVLGGLVDRHFEVGAVNQRIDPAWLDQGLAPNPGWGIPCIDADAEIRDGHVIVHYTYEGQEADYSFAENAVTYSFQPSEEDLPIEKHPYIAALITQLGYNVETREFPQYVTSEGSGIPHGYNQSNSGQKINPLFGWESWRSWAGEYTYTYARRTVPASAWAGVNNTIVRPPGIEFIGGNFSNRPWLKKAPVITRRGNVSEIAEGYVLGMPGGIAAARLIYDTKGLSSKGARSSGLTTGGLTTGSL